MDQQARGRISIRAILREGKLLAAALWGENSIESIATFSLVSPFSLCLSFLLEMAIRLSEIPRKAGFLPSLSRPLFCRARIKRARMGQSADVWDTSAMQIYEKVTRWRNEKRFGCLRRRAGRIIARATRKRHHSNERAFDQGVT